MLHKEKSGSGPQSGEVKADEPLSLRDQLILCIFDYKEQNKTAENSERTNRLLEKLGALENEDKTFPTILEIINDFRRKDSLLGNSTQLRGKLSELLCQYLGINKSEINQTLKSISSPAEPDLMRNLIMHRLINAEFAKFANFESDDFSEFAKKSRLGIVYNIEKKKKPQKKLAELRETLHCSLSTFFACEKITEDAFDFLTIIYSTDITTEGELIKQIQENHYGPKENLESTLLVYINKALCIHFKISKEITCTELMNDCRKQDLATEGTRLSKIVIDWTMTYNSIITPRVTACLTEYFDVYLPTVPTVIEGEDPKEPATTKKPLVALMVEKIEEYKRLGATGDKGRERAKNLTPWVIAKAQTETELFNTMVQIYNGSHEEFSLGSGKTLRKYIGEALVIFLEITEGQLCAQEMLDCEERLRTRDKIDYRKLRTETMSKLINKVVQGRNKAEQDSEEMKNEKPTLIKKTRGPVNLIDQLVLCTLDYRKQKNNNETFARTHNLLEALHSPTNEAEAFSTMLEIINNFEETSLLGSSTQLRGKLSELLCRYLGIDESEISQNLKTISAPDEPSLVRNLIMHRLINEKFAKFADFESDDFSKFAEECKHEIVCNIEKEKTPREKLAELRATLHFHLSLFFKRNKTRFITITSEEKEAFHLLTRMYSTEINTAADLIRIIKKNYYDSHNLQSNLFTYINSGLCTHFKIPEEKICTEIMDQCRRLSSHNKIPHWGMTYNSVVTPMVIACLAQYLNCDISLTTIKVEDPKPAKQKKSLSTLMFNKILEYNDNDSPGDAGSLRAKELIKQVNILQENENETRLFNEMVGIYNGYGENSFLKKSIKLRDRIGQALAKFLKITEGQLCVQEFRDCEERLKTGGKINYTELRHEARRKLINETVQDRKKAAQDQQAIAEMKVVTEEVGNVRLHLPVSLKDQLILFLYDHQKKINTSETINRTNELLKKVRLLENENETLSAILEVINDFSATSLLGNSIRLRGALSELLCKYLDINQTTIDQHLRDNHTPAGPGLMCNLVMQGLINKAKHKRNNVHDEKPSSADAGQEESPEDKLAKLRETLHGCILLLFTSHLGEEQDAFSLLTKIYDTKITTRTSLMELMNHTYYESTAKHANSRLFYYINRGLFSYFHIPAEDTCVGIMSTYRTRNQDFRNGAVVDSSSLPKRVWHAVYNLNVAPAIAKYVQEYLGTTLTEVKREAPEPVTEKRALKDILVEKISKYTKLVSLESEGLQRVSILKNIVENAKSENALFHQVKEIYDDPHILSTSNILRNYIGDALAEFLRITEGQICVQEYHNCKEVFADGSEARLDYGRVRDTAVCELVDKTAKQQYPAKDKPIELKQVQIGLKDQLILFILAYKEKNKSTKNPIRTDNLLEKLNLLQNEDQTFSAILEVINDFSETSLLGNSTKLRGALSELLCKRLGIHQNIVDNNLKKIQAPTQPGLLRNLIMQRLINNAEYERRANVHDEKPSCDDTAQEKLSQKKLATFRETLHYHISLLFISNVGEQEEALSFLTEIYRNTSTRADLIALIKKKMKNDAGFTCTDSRLLYYINQAVIGYLKIPEEEFCLAIMDTCRRQNQTPTGTSPLHPVMVDSSTPMMPWHVMYNLSVVPIIFGNFHAVALREIKTEDPNPVTQKDSLKNIMLKKIALYKKQESPGKQDLEQVSNLKNMVETAESEDALFSQMKKIYDDFSGNSFLKTDNALRSYTGYALAEFLEITAGQVAVQEYHSCKELLSRGARLDYTDVRDTAIRGLVNAHKTTRSIVEAERNRKAGEEVEKEANTLTNRLMCSIGEHVGKCFEKNDKESAERANRLLERIMENAPEDENAQLKWCVGTFNNWEHTSLLSGDIILRYLMGKTLCEALNIRRESSFMERSPCIDPLCREIEDMQKLIRVTYLEQVIIEEFDKVRLHLPR